MSIQLRIAQPGQAAPGRSQEDWGGERAEPPPIPLPTQGSGQPGPVRQVGASVEAWGPPPGHRAAAGVWITSSSHPTPRRVLCLHISLSTYSMVGTVHWGGHLSGHKPINLSCNSGFLPSTISVKMLLLVYSKIHLHALSRDFVLSPRLRIRK